MSSNTLNRIFFFFYIFTDTTSDGHSHPSLETQHSMRLFRAQRNFYISGFSIFLVLVIRRLVILISAQAQLLAQSEASMRQAQSATTAARSLLSQQKDDKPADPKEAEKSNELVGFAKFVCHFSYFLLSHTHNLRYSKYVHTTCLVCPYQLLKQTTHCTKFLLALQLI